MFQFLTTLSVLARFFLGASDLLGCVKVSEYCPNSNITFWFYTRSTQNNPTQLDVSQPNTIKNARFEPSRPFKIIIHGYTGWKDYSPNTEIRPALFQSGEYNVISVDYGPIVKEPCYLSAVRNVKVVANCTAQLIDHLVAKRNIQLNRFHIIGFSLGAHVSGTISEYLKTGKLTRISGLDPAFPLFWSSNPQGRLDKTDAHFVDVIHTNSFMKGTPVACGHVDFYCNGGTHQPGCYEPDVENKDSCNHARAPAYYAESINSEKSFWGCACGFGSSRFAQLEIMGFNTSNKAQGTYCVTTNGASEYALGKPKSCT